MEINSKARAFLLIDKMKQSRTALYFARTLWSGQKDVAGSMVKRRKHYLSSRLLSANRRGFCRPLFAVEDETPRAGKRTGNKRSHIN